MSTARTFTEGQLPADVPNCFYLVDKRIIVKSYLFGGCPFKTFLTEDHGCAYLLACYFKPTFVPERYELEQVFNVLLFSSSLHQ